MKYTFQLSCQNHLLCTVQTADVDNLGGPDGISAAGADILPGGTGSGGYRWRGRRMCAGSSDAVAAVFVPIDQNIAQVII